MQISTTNIKLINEIAWALSVANAEHKLDVKGEYIWARPSTNNFADVRARQKSIFSSGNSIKDQEVIDFIQGVHATKFLLDPWIVKEFEDRFPKWIAAGTRYQLKNFEQFKYTGFSAGTQETFINFYLTNIKKRFRIFKGDYWWHMDIWASINADWAYIEDDEIRENDVCICSCPFALTGEKHSKFDWLVNECERTKVNLLVDFIYLPNSMNTVDVDLSSECIQQITFSLSKTFPVQCAKIAVRMCKTKPNDPLQISNDENICNRVSAGLALAVIDKFPVDFNVTKYKDKQKHWCDKLGLKASSVVHFATGEDYTATGRDSSQYWYSPFNNQQGRYNLGMLYENESLLKKLGLF